MPQIFMIEDPKRLRKLREQGFLERVKEIPSLYLRWWSQEIGKKLPWPTEATPEQVFSLLQPFGGVIKAPRAKARALRQLVREELKRRRLDRPIEEPFPEGYVKRLIRDVAARPWFHGRRSYPKRGETFAFAWSRRGLGNLGEPAGISLGQPFRKSAVSFVTVPKKRTKVIRELEKKANALRVSRMFLLGKEQFSEADKLLREALRIEEAVRRLARAEAPVARVLPLLGEPAEEVILPGWVGEGTRKAQALLKEAYINALRETPEAFTPTGKLSESWRNAINLKEFNEKITEYLKRKGYKGILYSPHRYGEFELKIFDPSDVVLLDLRRPRKDVGLHRLLGTSPLNFSPDVFPKTRYARFLNDWFRELQGHPHSLRDIYMTMDLSKVTLP